MGRPTATDEKSEALRAIIRAISAADHQSVQRATADALGLSKGALNDFILDGDGAPVARIEARDLGIAGGRVSVEVAAASDGDATHRKVILRLGSYSEVYDDLDFTAEGGTGSQDESLLVLPFVHLKRAVPEIRSALTLGNGAGGVLDAVRNRLLGLAALPVGEGALRAVEVDLLRETVLDLERTWAEKPTLRNVLAQREAELTAVMTDAQRLTTFLGSGLAW